jgi:hypothetical protein
MNCNKQLGRHMLLHHKDANKNNDNSCQQVTEQSSSHAVHLHLLCTTMLVHTLFMSISTVYNDHNQKNTLDNSYQHTTIEQADPSCFKHRGTLLH